MFLQQWSTISLNIRTYHSYGKSKTPPQHRSDTCSIKEKEQ